MKKIRIAAVCIAAVLVCLAACKSGETPEKGSPKSPGPTVESAQSAPQKTETVPEPEKTPETAPAPLQEQEQPPQTPEPAVNPATSFTRMSYKELVADDGSREELKELPKDDGYTVEVDLTNCIVTVFAKDGSTALQALCTVGKKETPTPAGNSKWAVKGKGSAILKNTTATPSTGPRSTERSFSFGAVSRAGRRHADQDDVPKSREGDLPRLRQADRSGREMDL